MRPGPCVLQRSSCAQYHCVFIPSADNLQAAWQAAVIPAAGHAVGRVTGQIEEVEIGRPTLSHVTCIDPADRDWVERAMLNLQRGPAHGRREDEIVFTEPRLCRTEMSRAPIYRLQELLAGIGTPCPDTLDKARIKLARDLIEASIKPCSPVRLLQHTPRWLGILDLVIEKLDLTADLAERFDRGLALLAHLLIQHRIAD